jgi:hypothetical protein
MSRRGETMIRRITVEPGFCLLQVKVPATCGYRNTWWIEDMDTGEWIPLTDLCRLLGLNPSAVYSRKEAIVAGRLEPGELFHLSGPDSYEISVVDTGWTPPVAPLSPFPCYVMPMHGL